MIKMHPDAEIRLLLERFQEGYTRRDVSQTDSFMELFTADAEVIGTNGVRPGLDEWYMDSASARELVEATGKAGATCGWIWIPCPSTTAGMWAGSQQPPP